MTFPLMPFAPPSSTLGQLWEEVGGAYTGDLYCVATRDAGVIMMGIDGDDVLFSDDYGATSTVKSISGNLAEISGIAYGAGLWVACSEVSTDRMYSSADDGDSWAQRFSGFYSDRGLNFNDGYFISSAGTSGGTGRIAFSTDGITWLLSPVISGSGARTGIYVSALNRTFLGAGALSVYRNNVPPYASNGDTWTGSSTGLTGATYDVEWSPSAAVAVCVGSDGIFYSYNMIGWTKSLTALNLRGVVWCGELFTAVGLGGKIYTSDNGVSWTEQTSGTSEDLLGVTYTGGSIIAVGTSGTVLRSS